MDQSERPLLPAAVFLRILTYLGEGKANDTEADVREGRMPLEEAIDWSLKVEESGKRAENRPDIEPEDWQAFEEGWRPEGW